MKDDGSEPTDDAEECTIEEFTDADWRKGGICGRE